MRTAFAVVGSSALAWGFLLGACGDRTDLPGDVAPAPVHELDASRRDATDAALDVPLDIPADDAVLVPDVPVPNDCPDAAATLIYVITVANDLYSFDPRTNAFRPIGRVPCLERTGSFSMAVDRAGIAYVLDNNGAIHRVDTGTAACRPLPYVAGQHGFTHFGMGFASDVSADGGTTGETLYVEADPYFSGGGAKGLARIDTKTWQLTVIGKNDPTLKGGELTGTGGGELYAFFWYSTDKSGSRVGRLDKSTGMVVADVHLATPDLAGQGASFAFAFWGGNFYLFTDAKVTEYLPASGSTSVVATLPGAQIVGAGVSTCAPP